MALSQKESASPASINVGSSSCSSAFSYKIYSKHQAIDDVYTFGASDNFVSVPNLNESFHVTRNTLFRITFQGGFWFNSQNIIQYTQLMVNNYLIVGDKILPNNAQRLGESASASRNNVDRLGGAVHHDKGWATMSITRIVMIYLPPGNYTFTVGVRCSDATGHPQRGTGNVHGGMMTFELTQFQNDEIDLGSFKLTTLPE